MNTYLLPTGELELGDFPARKKSDWLNLAWIITHQCTMGCPYCVGWKSQTSVPTLIGKMGGVDNVVAALERLREHTKKHVYMTISGGEPTMVPQLPQLYSALGKRGFTLELHTNLTTGRFQEWLAEVDPKYIGQVMAMYHGWRADKEKIVADLYFRNFYDAVSHGMTCVLKTMALPTEIASLSTKVAQLANKIPAGSPILPWVFIHGAPKSVTEANGAYPQAYTQEQRLELARNTSYRRTCQQLYCAGAGWFKGMRCDAGCSYAYMDIAGNIFPCFGRQNDKIGNLVSSQFNFHRGLQVCDSRYCGTPFWGLWYGENPWAYIPGATQANAYYCRFGPAVSL